MQMKQNSWDYPQLVTENHIIEFAEKEETRKRIPVTISLSSNSDSTLWDRCQWLEICALFLIRCELFSTCSSPDRGGESKSVIGLSMSIRRQTVIGFHKPNICFEY